MHISTLTVRRQFLFIAQGRKASGRFVMLQGRPTSETGPRAADSARFGLTASKKVGNAVARNRARRRLRHLLTELMPRAARPGWDYVAVARTATVEAPWDQLTAELEGLFARLHAPSAQRTPDRLKGPHSSAVGVQGAVQDRAPHPAEPGGTGPSGPAPASAAPNPSVLSPEAP
jgi:ribonuclease P protein component